jgi:hypothetical protein
MENKVGFLLQKSFVCVEIIFSGLKNANYLPPPKKKTLIQKVAFQLPSFFLQLVKFCKMKFKSKNSK